MKRRRKDSGFAMLLVFLMAAAIAITLYMEVPRVAFDSQRQKEQLLIERGEQYKIAIRRFLQANRNRWPASMDELESFNNRRFLRHRYKDPMTGKDEWRLIHIQNGVLTDSKNQKKPTDQTKNSTPNTFIQEMAGLGTGPTGPTGRNAATRMRPSDANAANMPGMTSGTPPDPNNPNQPVPPAGGVVTPQYPTPGQTGQPGYPAQPGMPPQPGQPGMPGYPGATAGNTGTNAPQTGGGFIANQPGLGSVGTSGVATGQNGQPVYPGQQMYPGQQPYPGAPGAPVNSQTGGVSPYPVQPGANPGQPNQAANLINNILTSPRPGGFPGVQQGGGIGPGGGLQNNSPFGNTGQQTIAGPGGPGTTQLGSPQFGSAPGAQIGSPIGTGGTTIGGGIAGVASNADADSIMVYYDHTNYSEWEFIFDPTKWHAPPNPNVGTVGTAASQLGSSVNNLNSGINGTGASMTSGLGGPMGGGALGGGAPGGGAPGGGAMPGGQMGTSGAGQFGGGGLPDIRPGRR